MNKFTVVLERQVIDFDQVTVEVEADSEADAYAIARTLTEEYNNSCPDDVVTVSANNCSAWYVEHILPA